MKKGTILTCIALMIFSVFFYYLTFGFEYERTYSEHAPGPGFFPRLVLGALFVLCIVAIVIEMKKNSGESVLPPNIAKIGVISLLMVLYPILFDFLGYYVVTTAFSLTVMYLLGVQKLKVLFSVALGTIAFIYVFFFYMLKINFPLGILEGLFS